MNVVFAIAFAIFGLSAFLSFLILITASLDHDDRSLTVGSVAMVIALLSGGTAAGILAYRLIGLLS